MPAPEFNVQTPGDPLANAITTTASTDNPDAGTQAPAVPDFTAKHNGGGRWVVIDLTPAAIRWCLIRSARTSRSQPSPPRPAPTPSTQPRSSRQS